MRNSSFLLFFFILFTTSWAYSQTEPLKKSNIEFVTYLLKMDLDSDFVFLMKDLNRNAYLSPSQTDSLSFLMGRYFDKTNKFDSAQFYFNKIPRSSVLYPKSFFWNHFEKIHNEAFGASDYFGVCETCNSDSLFNQQMCSNFKIASSLYLRDTSEYQKIRAQYSNYRFNNYDEIYSKLRSRKKKSGFLAGSLSAVVPGLGKVYSGKRIEGLTTFIPVTLMGVQCYEAFRKKNSLLDARFLISASLFSVFYIGNIWGSYISVSVVRNEFDKNINNEILLNLRVPLNKYYQ